MEFHSGRVRVTPIYPNLDDTAQWVFPEDVEYLEGVGKENDMHVRAWTRHDGSSMWYNIPPKCFK